MKSRRSTIMTVPGRSACLALGAALAAVAVGGAEESGNLNDLPAILVVPEVVAENPAAGRRVRQTTPGWENSSVHHALYLPRDWKPGTEWPVIVEFPGNGGFANALGDRSDGSVEGCQLGYGLSGGEGFIWISMPFVDASLKNTPTWWGDVSLTKRYCRETVRDVCTRFGGDPKRVVLAGFSRGAIACTYIGLHDDEMAALWCGLIGHSHHEATFPHPGPDRDTWPSRLARLGDRPCFISHEMDVEPIRLAIESAGIRGSFTYSVLPWPNHTAAWALRDVPLRSLARDWLLRVTASH